MVWHHGAVGRTEGQQRNALNIELFALASVFETFVIAFLVSPDVVLLFRFRVETVALIVSSFRKIACPVVTAGTVTVFVAGLIGASFVFA